MTTNEKITATLTGRDLGLEVSIAQQLDPYSLTLEEVSGLIAYLEGVRENAVTEWRIAGRSWSQIGAAVGTSKQAAAQKYKSRESMAKFLRDGRIARGEDPNRLDPQPNSAPATTVPTPVTDALRDALEQVPGQDPLPLEDTAAARVLATVQAVTDWAAEGHPSILEDATTDVDASDNPETWHLTHPAGTLAIG